jgi:putative membrane protein
MSKKWPKSVYSKGVDPDFRASLANERTALAMIRTALALVATGLAIAALQQYINLNGSLKTIAVIVSAAGALVGIMTVFRWMSIEKAMRLNKPLPAPNILFILALVIFISGILGIISII